MGTEEKREEKEKKRIGDLRWERRKTATRKWLKNYRKMEGDSKDLIAF